MFRRTMANVRDLELKGKEELGQAGAVRQEVKLNTFQLDALQNILARKAGLSTEHFRDCQWFNSLAHVRALNLELQQHPAMAIEEILAKLKAQSPLQLQAMLVGIDQEASQELNDVQLKLLMTFGQSYIARQLRFAQDFNIASFLYERPWLQDEQLPEVLEKMVLAFGCDFEASVDSLKGLSYYQLYVLKNGMCYGVTVDDLRDQDWLDRPERALALSALLKNREKYAALEICQAAQQEWQLEAIKNCKNGFGVEEVVQLQHEAQFNAWCSLHDFGLEVEHLQEHDWFTSKYHTLVMKRLLESGCRSIHLRTQKQRTEILNEFENRADISDLQEDSGMQHRLQTCEQADRAARKAYSIRILQDLAGTSAIDAKILHRHKLANIKQLARFNAYQKLALANISKPALSLVDVQVQQWLNSDDRLWFFKLLLKDSRIHCLRFNRKDFGVLTAELANWSDDDFARAILAAKRDGFQKGPHYVVVPAVTAILESARLRENRLNKCTVM